MATIKGGRYARWYANGSAVGIGLIKTAKSDISTPLEKVLEIGDPNIVEYYQKIPETTLSIAYSVISYAGLAAALGQTGISNGAANTPVTTTAAFVGEVPALPSVFDVVERLITPGTEGTLTETYQGFCIYQNVQVEKESWDLEVDKVLAVDISGKCKRPRRFVNIAGIQFDKFTGNGSTTAYVLSQKARQLGDGYYTIRVETPLLTVLKETVDYTVGSTSSTTTVTFTVAPASATAANILTIYAY